MSILSKLQPAFILLSALIGIALGRHFAVVEENAGSFIEPFLVIMLFFVFLSVNIKEISKCFANIKFTEYK